MKWDEHPKEVLITVYVYIYIHILAGNLPQNENASHLQQTVQCYVQKTNTRSSIAMLKVIGKMMLSNYLIFDLYVYTIYKYIQINIL